MTLIHEGPPIRQNYWVNSQNVPPKSTAAAVVSPSGRKTLTSYALSKGAKQNAEDNNDFRH